MDDQIHFPHIATVVLEEDERGLYFVVSKLRNYLHVDIWLDMKIRIDFVDEIGTSIPMFGPPFPISDDKYYPKGEIVEANNYHLGDVIKIKFSKTAK